MGRVRCVGAFGRYRGREGRVGLFGETGMKEAIWKTWA